MAFRQLRLPPASDVFLYSGYQTDDTRNRAVAAALERGHEWMGFLDDDVIPPADAFEHLTGHGLDLVSGLYCKRMDAFTPVAMTGPPLVPIGGYRAGETLRVAAVGAGCLVIHRRVLEAVARPWFEWRGSREDLPPEARLSEDFEFCRKVREAGFGLWVDTLVACRHAGWGAAEVPGRFTPLGVV